MTQSKIRQLQLTHLTQNITLRIA